MIAAISSALSAITSSVSGIFTSKNIILQEEQKTSQEEQISIQRSMEVLSAEQSTEGARMRALADIATSDNTSIGWSSKLRPILAVMFVGFVVFSFWGIVPPNLSETRLDEMWNWALVSLSGMYGIRSLERGLNKNAENKMKSKLIEIAIERPFKEED